MTQVERELDDQLLKAKQLLKYMKKANAEWRVWMRGAAWELASLQRRMRAFGIRTPRSASAYRDCIVRR